RVFQSGNCQKYGKCCWISRVLSFWTRFSRCGSRDSEMNLVYYVELAYGYLVCGLGAVWRVNALRSRLFLLLYTLQIFTNCSTNQIARLQPFLLCEPIQLN